MEKNTILAIILCLAVYLIWWRFVAPKLYPPSEDKDMPAQVGKERGEFPYQETVKEDEWDIGPGKRIVGEEIPPSDEFIHTPTISAEERTITVDTPLYRARLTTLGGGLTNWMLKGYRESVDPESTPVDLVSWKGKGLLPLKIKYPYKESGIPDPVPYESDLYSIALNNGETRTINLRYHSESWIVEKNLTFWGDNYNIGVNARARKERGWGLGKEVKLSWVERIESGKKQTRFSYNRPILFQGQKVKRLKDMEGESIKFMPEGGKIRWIGFENKYFLRTIIPSIYGQRPDRDYVVAEISRPSPDASLITVGSSSCNVPGNDAPGELPVGTCGWTLYLGPKDYKYMTPPDIGMEKSIDLGWFKALAKPFYWVLNFLYEYTHNYGVAIIILTVIIKIIFYPFTQKSMESMKQMQKLQPLMQNIKQRYKDDREKLNREIMNLYKTHKVNPLGGCLPLLLQLPVFIALYNVLLNAIELRHAPFLFWIRDLSSKDPYYITPILMGGTMFLQQKMSPSSLDPTQARMMYLMPIIFTVMFLNFPSGLVIYWLVNNLLSIAQQYFLYRKKEEKKS